MMKRFIVLACVSLALASPAVAKTTYEPMETREPIIDIGKGGTRTTKHEIDYWTTGTPPRKFQILGVITDRRGTGRLHGNAVGSKSIAKMVKEAGGDAVVIVAQNERATGVISGGNSNSYGNATASVYGNQANVYGQNQTYGNSWSTVVSKRSTAMVVVKYLPD